VTVRIDIAALQRLAALSLEPAEQEKIAADLQRILDHIDTMASVEVEGIEPMDLGPGSGGQLRPDEPRASLPRDVVFRAAPEARGGHFAVPSVLPADPE